MIRAPKMPWEYEDLMVEALNEEDRRTGREWIFFGWMITPMMVGLALSLIVVLWR